VSETNGAPPPYPTAGAPRRQDHEICLRLQRLRAGSFRSSYSWDIRSVLPTISVPANQDATLDEIQGFLSGVRREPDLDRVLATVLFTDILSSTGRPARGSCATHTIARPANTWITTEGTSSRPPETVCSPPSTDPPGPIRCAGAIADEVRPKLVEIRAGLHAGEVDLRGCDIGGIAVALAARAMAEAGAGRGARIEHLRQGPVVRLRDRLRYSRNPRAQRRSRRVAPTP
jgi:hypothetical protein